MATTITITTPKDHQTYQRNGSNQASITISGAYTGSDPSAVEVQHVSGSWTVLDAAPAGGTYTGTFLLTEKQGMLTVRDAGNTGVTASKAYVSLGDVFVPAGQSNAQGRLANPQVYSHATLKATMFRQDDAWSELTDPTDSDAPAGSYSVWPLLATHIMAHTGYPVAFITTAKGDTRLVGGSWTKPGVEYTDCVQTVNNSGVNAVRAILWHQGETDVNNSVAKSTYKTRLGQLVDNLQADCAALAGVKLVCAQIGYKTTNSPTREDIDAIRLAQTEILDEDTDILAGPILYDVNLDDAGGDGVHFRTDTEAQILADRWWRMLKFHYFSGSDGRAPRYASSRVIGSGDQIEVSMTVAVPPLVSPDTVGWRVVDATGLRTVSACTVDSSTKLVITCDQVLVQPVLVSFASFNDGADTTIRDSGTIPLPPEPFVDQAPSGLSVGGGGWGRFR